MVEKKFPLPKEVEVGPYVYTIAHGDVTTRRQLGGDHGETDHSELIIKINERATGVVRETLVHELLHALSDLAGLQEQYGAEADEQWCRRIAPWLLDTLRRNPNLVDFLLTDLDL
jgi:hypothetical protein